MNEEIFLVGQSEYAGQTTVHPLGLLAVAVLGLCVLLLPRRWSVVPMLVMASFVSPAQRIVVAGADFDFLRIMVLFGVMRLILRKEYREFIWRPLDTAVALWAASSIVFFVIREGTFASVVNRLGFGFNAFGMYFLFRCLVKDYKELDRLVLGLIFISIPVAFFFIQENRTGRNLFSVFGGVSEFTSVREGRIRCQGAYAHPILAGSFWATIVPLLAAVFWNPSQKKILAAIGIISASTIVFLSASSTPYMSLFSGVVGGLMFFFRRWMRLMRWGILLLLVVLHFVMQAPVWHLISRIDPTGGATGWHRYNLINQAIVNFSDWWLVGCSGYAVASWGIHAGDVTNQYILEGVLGGFLTMCLFIVVIAYAFRNVGILWRQNIGNPYRLAMSWALGVSLFVHCVNFIGVSYFGQIYILWYLLLAIIGSMTTFSDTHSKIKEHKNKWRKDNFKPVRRP